MGVSHQVCNLCGSMLLIGDWLGLTVLCIGDKLHPNSRQIRMRVSCGYIGPHSVHTEVCERVSYLEQIKKRKPCVTLIKHDGCLRTRRKCRKREPC